MSNDWMWQYALQGNNSTTQNTIPKWLTDASKYGVQKARGLLDDPGQRYTGELASGLTSDQIAAGDLIRNSVGKYQPGYDAATDLINQSTGANQNVTADTYRNSLSGINDYMNPFVNNVVNVASANGARALANNLNNLRSKAPAGAAYGSRYGVQEGAAAADNSLNQQNYIYEALSGAFDKATGLMGEDISNKLKADTTNATNYESYMDRLKNAGTAAADVNTAARTANVGDINNVLQYGIMDQHTRDKLDKANYDEFLRMQNNPYLALKLYNDTLASAPRSTTSTTNSTSFGSSQVPATSSNPWLGGLGGAMGGAVAGAPLGPWGVAAGAAAGGALGALK